MKLNNDALMAHRYKRSDHPLIREMEAALRRHAAMNASALSKGYTSVTDSSPTDCVSHTMACIAVEELTGDPHAHIPDEEFHRIWRQKDNALLAAIPYLQRYIVGCGRQGIARWALQAPDQRNMPKAGVPRSVLNRLGAIVRQNNATEEKPGDFIRYLAKKWLEKRAPGIAGMHGGDWAYQTICAVRDLWLTEAMAIEPMEARS